MNAISRSMCMLILAVCCSACGGDGIDITVDPPPPLPEQPQVTLEGQTKQLVFSWAAVTGADHYRLMENPDGHSGFTQVGDDIPAGTLTANRDIAVHLHDWVNALYMVQACNIGGCAGSAEVSTADVMLDTIGYFKASNTQGYDAFGGAVALSADGNTLAVGAHWEDGSATGINGDQAHIWGFFGAGAVYLFRFDGTSWAQQAYIKASNTEHGDGFGRVVALSADGNTLAVSAHDEDSSATGINGDQADNSASDAGAVYLFRFDGTSWTQQAYIKASNTEAGDWFGGAVALSADGNTLAASGGGAVYLFQSDGQTWSQQAYIKATNTEGGDVSVYAGALSADGNTLAVSGGGAVYLFRSDGQTWSQQAYIKASNTAGGDVSVSLGALSADGDTLAASGGGAVYLFRFDGTSWTQQAYIKASNTEYGDRFGWPIALSADGDTLAAGAKWEDSNATGINGDRFAGYAFEAGAVYLFQSDGQTWSQQAYIKASNTRDIDPNYEEYGAEFGSSVALSADGNTLAVGARGEHGCATGINVDQAGQLYWCEGAGAVYVY